MSGIIRVYVNRVRGTVDREGANAAAARVGLTEVTDLCRKIVNQATIDAPVDKGFLRGQHGMTVKTMRTKVKGTVINRAKYAAAVHDGSGPHIIRARKKKALRFEVGGKVVFARSVRHPGTRGRPWLAKAAERAAVTAGFRFQRTVVSD
jgi:hypothetical protein